LRARITLRICPEIQKVADAPRVSCRHRIRQSPFFSLHAENHSVAGSLASCISYSRRGAPRLIGSSGLDEEPSIEKPRADVQIKMRVRRRFLSDDEEGSSHGL
jgi:hypothetical protein